MSKSAQRPLRPIPLSLAPLRTPRERVNWELGLLSHARQDLVTNAMIGPGRLSPSEIKENERRQAEFNLLRLEIIVKHGAERDFGLPPVLTGMAVLIMRLGRVEVEFAALEQFHDQLSKA